MIYESYDIMVSRGLIIEYNIMICILHSFIVIVVGRDDRIYRDGSMERFLNDVVGLLGNETNCPPVKSTSPFFDSQIEFQVFLYFICTLVLCKF